MYLKQSNADISRFGMADSASEPSLMIYGEVEGGSLEALLPKGFKAFSMPEFYDEDNLYEKINGKAPFYVEAGFRKLATQRFVSGENPDLWMELFIFDMGDMRNAFSVYSLQKRADCQNLEDGTAYRTGNSLYMIHGRDYVEIIGSAESEKLFAAIAETSDNIRKGLATEGDKGIPELMFFPKENLILGSTRLYLASAFGFKGLGGTFTAQYKIDGEIVTVFLTGRDGASQAADTAQNYLEFLNENGAAVKRAINKTLEGKVLEFYGTTEIVTTAGNLVVGVHEAQTQMIAEKAVLMLLDRINNDKTE